MFSTGTYTKTSATGQTVLRQHERLLPASSRTASCKIEGKAFDYVEVSKKRMDYAQASGSDRDGAC